MQTSTVHACKLQSLLVVVTRYNDVPNDGTIPSCDSCNCFQASPAHKRVSGPSGRCQRHHARNRTHHSPEMLDHQVQTICQLNLGNLPPAGCSCRQTHCSCTSTVRRATPQPIRPPQSSGSHICSTQTQEPRHLRKRSSCRCSCTSAQPSTAGVAPRNHLQSWRCAQTC